MDPASYGALREAGPAVGGFLGSIGAGSYNSAANNQAYIYQKRLAEYQYILYNHYAKLAGATPTALIQGLTGSGPNGIPSASTGGNPMPDLGQTFNGGLSAIANLRSSEAAQTTANSQREIDLMRLQFEPKKYFADIQQSLAKAFESTKTAFLHGSMKTYYDELSKDLQQIRPWKIAGLQQGLLNDMARYNEIVQHTFTLKAQEGNYNASSSELYSRIPLNRANAFKATQEGFNAQLDGYKLQFENTLRTYGIDPTKGFWENTLRLATYSPGLFKQRMDMFLSTLNGIDNRIKEELGENYKRNAIMLGGLYYLNKTIQSNKNSRSYRNSNAFNTVTKLLPFLGGISGSAPIGIPYLLDID